MFVWYRENGLCRIKQGRQIQSGPASETLTVDSNVIGKETTAGAAPGSRRHCESLTVATNRSSEGWLDSENP